MSLCIEGYRDGVVLTNQRIVGNIIYALDMTYGADVNLSKSEKRDHTFKVCDNHPQYNQPTIARHSKRPDSR